MIRFLLSRVVSIVFLVLGVQFSLMAQKLTEEKLNGCWKIKSIEFLHPTEDSAEIIKSAKGIITCFDKNGKFVTKIKTDDSEQIIGTGSFSIGADGKTVSQKRDVDDGGIDEPAEANMVNDNEITFKVEQLILHYERIPL